MSSYTVRVEWPDTTDRHESAALAGDLIGKLGPTSAVGPGRVMKSGAVLPWTASITVDATTPRGAATKAVGAVESATGKPATGFEVLTTEEHDARQALPPFPDLVGNIEIADMLGVSRQRVIQLVQLEGFPPAVVTTQSGSLRVREHVEAWEKSWQRRSGRPPRAAADADTGS